MKSTEAVVDHATVVSENEDKESSADSIQKSKHWCLGLFFVLGVAVVLGVVVSVSSSDSSSSDLTA